MRPRGEHLSTAIAALISLGLAAYVNFSVTQSYFWGDDFFHLYRLRNVPLLQFLMQTQGGHMQEVPFAIYYALTRVAGTWAAPYFWSAFLTHLLNVALLFVVIRRVTASDRLACFGAALWGTSPVLQESMTWYATYGNLLLGTWLLCVLLVLTGVERRGQASWGACAGLVALLFLEAITFGVGMGVVLAAPAAAFVFLRESPARSAILKACCVVALAVPPLYLAVSYVFPPQQGPMIGLPLPILALVGHLLGYGIARTSLGTLSPTHEFPGASGAVAIVLFAGGALAVRRWGSARARRSVLAFLLLAIGGYCMIALGRAAFYSRDPGLVGNADRYQYVGPLTITLCWCVMLGELGGRVRAAPWKTALLLIGVGAILGGHLGLPRPPLYQFDYSRQETNRVLGRIVTQITSAPEGEDVFIANQPFLPMGPMFVTAMDLFPGWAGLFVVFFPDDVVAGRRVHFVVSEPRVLEATRHGRRTASLVVATEAVPPAKLVEMRAAAPAPVRAPDDVERVRALEEAARRALQHLHAPGGSRPPGRP